ncbi:flagellar filament capping protein FliD [Marasmitruncus massiliensis]|uniref:flagellar filament capping protein FliD n=1 Tax=Marasmitruncus massiliensis TaxID=1944642 RepID=UPI000C7E838A|nr:flagellar filament capping protein FliD [Marasmitruncus massiliensis]
MNTVSSSNSYSTSAATSKGMSGLVSNMDTESMVESLLSGTQTKIDKQNQLKQTTTWKQEFYRQIITDINTFQSTFFNSSSSTNLMSASFFNAMSAVTKSEAVSVTATSSAAAGKTEIQVGQLATATKLQSGGTVSGTLTSALDLSALDRTVVFTVASEDDGTHEYSIDLSKCSTTQELADQIKEELKDMGSGISASVDEKTGKLVISGEGVSVSSKSSRLGMQMLGVSAGSKTTDGKLTTTADPDADATITVALDGVSHVITLDDIDKMEADLLKDDPDRTFDNNEEILTGYLQKQLDFEFGANAIKVGLSGKNMTLSTPTAGRQITVGGNKITYQLFGIQEGQSNKIALGQQLQNVGFSTALQGSSYTFTINGERFEIDNTMTVNQVINKINSSKANVRITYSELEDKFTIQSASTGSGYNITMTQEQGNLLNVMFGDVVIDGDAVKTGTTVLSNALTTNTVANSLTAEVKAQVDAVTTFTSGTFKLTVDGTAYSISVPAKSSGTYDREELFTLINQGLADRFGYAQSGEQNIALASDGTGYKLEVNNGSNVSFAKTDDIYTGDDIDPSKVADAAKTNLQLAFGFENTDNVAKSIEDPAISDLLTKIHLAGLSTSFDADTGKISITGTGTFTGIDDDAELMKKLFGTTTLQLGYDDPETPNVAAVAGQNAIVTINGVDTERSSNTFTSGGLSITLLETTGSYQKNSDGSFELDENGNKIFTGETATATTTKDTDKIYEGLKSFVEAYNKLIGDLNSRIDEEATYRDYAPLTSAQKKDMSESEIKLWEEKSKTGLLRNDTNISSFLSSMRSALYTKPDGSDFALYQIGIETSSEWEDKGKLVIDESKLKSMIETNSQDIQDLFANATDGLAIKLNSAIKATANTNSSTPGTLVGLAGVVGKATEITNTLTKQLRSINSKIEELQDKYETEKNRYWKMFDSMESALSSLNSQSSWLAQQFS